MTSFSYNYAQHVLFFPRFLKNVDIIYGYRSFKITK